MSTSAKTQSRQPTATRARTRTSARKGDRSTSLTSERIADDLAAFRKDGGKIEVLGNTQVFKSIGPMASASKTKAAAAKKPAASAVKKRA